MIFHRPAFPITEILLHPLIKGSMCHIWNLVHTAVEIIVNELWSLCQSTQPLTSCLAPVFPLIPPYPKTSPRPFSEDKYIHQAQTAHFLRICICGQGNLEARLLHLTRALRPQRHKASRNPLQMLIFTQSAAGPSWPSPAALTGKSLRMRSWFP